MIAIEIEADIVDHRVTVQSDLLPASVARARVIVMYEQAEAAPDATSLLSIARAAQASFSQRPPEVLAAELDELRAEWGRGQ